MYVCMYVCMCVCVCVCVKEKEKNVCFKAILRYAPTVKFMNQILK